MIMEFLKLDDLTKVISFKRYDEYVYLFILIIIICELKFLKKFLEPKANQKFI